MSPEIDTFICPNCGAEVPIGPRGCTRCHPVEEEVEPPAGKETTYDGLDLPGDDDFDYDRFVADEFGEPAPKRSGKELFWWIAALITLIAFALAWVI